MNKTFLTGLLCCSLSIQSFADQPLEGFTYGSVNAPTGKEWESPENLALNKEQPHAYFFPFQHLDNARKVLPENSKLMGCDSRTFKLEYLWHSKGRKPEVRNAYLRQPTGHLPAQREGG